MEIVLNDMEARVLGSLIEKKLATPDYYPLSLNALTNACNQKSNRDPVVSYDEMSVQEALDHLDQKGLVSKSAVSRVPKFEEMLTQDRNLVARESAVLCVLLLRGPQTPGMIRGRTSRLYNFESLDALHETMSDLEEWGYIKRLPRLPGHKESRYMHLFSGPSEMAEEEMPPVIASDVPMNADRMEKIEQDVASLRRELEELKNMFQAFKKQFE